MTFSVYACFSGNAKRKPLAFFTLPLFSGRVPRFMRCPPLYGNTAQADGANVQMCRRISRQAIQAEAAGAALLPTKFVKHNGQANMPSRRKPRTLRCCLKQSTKEYQMDIGYLSRRIADSHRFITAFAEYSPPSRGYSQSARHRPARSAAGLLHRDHAA